MERIVMSSNQIDSHGHQMTEQALQSSVDQINGTKRLPYNMNHRRELPPLGIIADARIEEKNKIILLTAAPILFTKKETIQYEGLTLNKESFDEDFQFVSRFDEKFEGISVSLDPSNFTSPEEFERLNTSIYNLNKEIALEAHGRKSQLPSPEIIFAIGATIEIAKFLINKIAENIVDDLYDEAKKRIKEFSQYATSVVKQTRQKAIPKTKMLTIIFEIHASPFIELVIKSDDPSLISKGLNPEKLKTVRKEIEKFCIHFNLDKIQFTLSEKGKWKFNYLITTKGEIIGQKLMFEERDKQYKRYEMQSQELASHRFNKPNPKKNKF